MYKNKKAVISIETIIGMALGVFVLVIMVLVFTNFTRSTVSALNQCEELGGMCVSFCTEATQGPGARQIFEGKGACEQNEICCTSNSIKERLTSGIGLPGSSEITLEVTGKTRKYKNLDRVPLFLGPAYGFTVKVDEKFKSNNCIARIVDSSRDIVINNNKNGRPLEIPSINCGQTIVFADTVFSHDNLHQNLELQVDVLGGDGRETSAEFRLDLENPVRLIGLNNRWAQYDDVTLRCAFGVICEKATFDVFEGPTLEIQKDKCYERERPGNHEWVDFLNGEAKLKLEPNENRFFDQLICFYVSIQNNAEWVKIISPNPVQLDRVPPSINDLDGREIKCTDTGSGECVRYYYYEFGKLTESDFNEMENAALELLFRRIREGVECPDIKTSLGSYRSTTNAMISTGNAIFATYCISAIDEAGNIAEPVIQEFVDTTAAANIGLDVGGSVLDFLIGLI